MDQGWRRIHLLLVFLTLWNHAIGYPSLNSHVNPRSLSYHKAFSPRGSKSLSGASTKNIPLGVHSNVLAVKSPSSSPFSQFGSASGTYESVSQTQSSPSGLVSASLALPQNLHESTPLLLQGSSSSNVQGMASQFAGGPGSYSQYDVTYKDRTGLQAGGSGPHVSAQGGSASLTGLSSQSPSTSSQYSPVSSAYPSLGSFSMAVSGPSSVKTSQFSFSSDSRGGSRQLETSRLAQGVSSHPVGSYVQSQGSPSQLAFGSPQYASASMAAAQTSSQQNQASAKSLSQSQTPQGWQPSASRFSQGSLTSAAMSQSRFSAAPDPRKSSASGGPLGQSACLYSSASMPSPQSGSSLHGQAAGSALSFSQSPAPQRLQPSASLSPQGFPSQGATFPSRLSLASGSGPSQLVSTQGASSYSGLVQSPSSYAPAPSLDVKVPVYSHATSSGSSSLQSQTWQPTTSRRAYSRFPSGAALMQTSFSPQSVQSSSRFSSVAGGTSRLLTQSRGSYTGSSQSLGSVGQYTPGSPAYAKFGASTQGSLSGYYGVKS